MEREIVKLMKEEQIQKYELWLKYFRKEEFSKEAILEVIASEIEGLKKQIEPQEQNLDKKVEFN